MTATPQVRPTARRAGVVVRVAGQDQETADCGWPSQTAAHSLARSSSSIPNRASSPATIQAKARVGGPTRGCRSLPPACPAVPRSSIPLRGLAGFAAEAETDHHVDPVRLLRGPSHGRDRDQRPRPGSRDHFPASLFEQLIVRLCGLATRSGIKRHALSLPSLTAGDDPTIAGHESAPSCREGADPLASVTWGR